MIHVDWNPSRRDVKVFSLLFVAFFGLIGYWVYRWTGATTPAAVTFSIGALIGIGGFFVPEAMRYIYIGWMAAVLPIGFVVSHVILAVIFYGVVTPVGLLMRLVGHDPMHRKFDTAAKSYWIPRDEQRSPKQYFRQF